MNKKTLIIIIVSAVLLLGAVWGITAAMSLNTSFEKEEAADPIELSTIPLKTPGKSGRLDETHYRGDVAEITDTQIFILISGKKTAFDLTEKTAQHIPILEIVVGDNIIIEVEPGTTTVKSFEKILSEA